MKSSELIKAFEEKIYDTKPYLKIICTYMLKLESTTYARSYVALWSNYSRWKKKKERKKT